MNRTKHIGLTGQEARHALLALAFVRGIPYHRIEFTTRENNKPTAAAIAAAAGILPKLWVEKMPLDEVQIRLAPVDVWLEQPAPAEFAQHVALSREAQILQKRVTAMRKRAQVEAERARVLSGN
jgi:hypothetical protein